ncbi:conserved membrane hypothetical protein [Candidatus Sulfobium mesophilum]|uniref:DUF4203 domain-containing protein n=1 Tax=Candidatus Sulfobium mesophilum TaxID=2016548 RepID=A0A2U3QL15_9BACT|nr:conserved membrane hypothetical protein [Candidatus Sulfobium mesophilum]
MDILRLILGAALLTMGQRLYWLFIGGIGFVLGFDLAKHFVHGQPHHTALVIAFFVGAVGAVLTFYFQKVAILAGGFIAGGYLFIELLRELGKGPGNYYLLYFILGGVIGAILMKVLFRWTLIVLSSFIGAGLIIRSFHFGQGLAGTLFILLVLTGIIVQAVLLGRKS